MQIDIPIDLCGKDGKYYDKVLELRIKGVESVEVMEQFIRLTDGETLQRNWSIQELKILLADGGDFENYPYYFSLPIAEIDSEAPHDLRGAEYTVNLGDIENPQLETRYKTWRELYASNQTIFTNADKTIAYLNNHPQGSAFSGVESKPIFSHATAVIYSEGEYAALPRYDIALTLEQIQEIINNPILP